MAVDVAGVLACHSLASVLRRCWVGIPDPGLGVRDEWRCHCPLPSHPAPVDPHRHKPSFAVHLSGRMAGRWHCFACDAGGDVISFVEAYAQVGFLDAVGLIESGGGIPRGSDPHLHLRPATRTPTGALAWEARPGSDRELPDPSRTPRPRLWAAMAEAWRYYALDGLAGLARRRLAERGIDLGPLEAREHRVLAGHTPRSRTGVVDQLRRRGFCDDELVDAGLASRHPDGSVEDFLTHRLVLAVRDGHDRVAGLIGRDVSGGERAKYLNTATTAIYDKAALLYWASRPTCRGADNLVVVEGAIDALAIDAAGAQADLNVAAVSPSGVALTAAHRAAIILQAAKPPVLCADGDVAGRAATTAWVMAMTQEGHEVVAGTLPDPADPADWLAVHGCEGLSAFLRDGCLDARPQEVRPVHAGRFLARAAIRDGHDLGTTRAALAAVGARLNNEDARHRFAEQAGRGLAEAGAGPDGWLIRSVLADIEAARRPSADQRDPGLDAVMAV
ncbi:MAG TPA: toprim domain-containing protein [Acidimicrobiales bacterium]|nr:toprim domain-containing protein [Acidimicrobiales bacterium]